MLIFPQRPLVPTQRLRKDIVNGSPSKYCRIIIDVDVQTQQKAEKAGAGFRAETSCPAQEGSAEQPATGNGRASSHLCHTPNLRCETSGPAHVKVCISADRCTALSILHSFHRWLLHFGQELGDVSQKCSQRLPSWFLSEVRSRRFESQEPLSSFLAVYLKTSSV